jgi:4-amino-4-deoxy-L-arabinose transferase-like glycosyltransferase
MLIVFPILAYILFVTLLRMRGTGYRAAMLMAATMWGIVATLSTEVLGLLHAITPATLACSWLVVVAVLFAVIIRQRPPRPSLAGWSDKVRQACAVAGWFNLALLMGVAMILGIVGLLAFATAPNTTDSVVYHLPRIVHWLQNQTVDFYPTNIMRQLHQPPGAEYLMLHTYALGGYDGWFAAIQWLSFVLCVIGVSLLAQSMGAGVRGQTLAAVVAATIPQGVLYASAAKNDYVLAVWLVALLYFLFEYKRNSTPAAAIWVGCALGLAVLTKGTALIFAPALLFAWWLLVSPNVRRAFFRHATIIVVLILLLNAGHFLRNIDLYGSPLGPSSESKTGDFKYSNDDFSPASLFSNLVRNVALHVGTSNVEMNSAMQNMAEAIVHATGANPNDPRTTWSYTTFKIPQFSTHEAVAGNPLHMFLAFLVLGIIAFRWKDLSRETIIAALGLLTAFVLFCAILRWQPWHTRLHLPLFVLGAAVIGVTLERAWSALATNSLAVLLLVISIPFLVNNQLRPLATANGQGVLTQDRTTQYFADSPYNTQDYVRAAQFIKQQHCTNIGVDLNLNDPEYLLSVLVNATGLSATRIQQVDVTTDSARYDTPADPPCAVICVGCMQDKSRQKTYLEQGKLPSRFGTAIVFAPGQASLPTEASCTFSFADGWHGLEQDGSGWWHWTDSKGQILVSAKQEGILVLRGEMFSIKQPNDVDFLVNDVKQLSLTLTQDQFSSIEPISLPLKAGETVIEFVSHNPAITIPTDTRSLAIAVKNLLLTMNNGAITCELQP